jgi:hypothetical protein
VVGNGVLIFKIASVFNNPPAGAEVSSVRLKYPGAGSTLQLEVSSRNQSSKVLK